MKRRVEQQHAEPSGASGVIVGAFAYPTLMTSAGALLLWAAFPPVGWSICAWIAPIPWLLLCRSQVAIARRSYWGIWLGGLLFWLAMLQGIRLAHWLNNFGWLALSCYLSVYLLAFIAIIRSITCGPKRNIPLWLAAPVVWTGLELLRGYLFTGFSAALLGHTQAGHSWLIQISDVTGAYGVSFLVMLGAAGLNELCFGSPPRRRWVPATAAVATLITACGYGWWRVENHPQPSEQPLHIALLQGTRDKVFEFNRELEQKTFQQYFTLMQRARDADPNLDLIVWPEGSFTALVPELIVDGPIELPPNAQVSLAAAQQNIEEKQQAFAEVVQNAVAEANRAASGADARGGKVNLVVGAATFEFHGAETRHYNSALWIDPTGKIAGRYYKIHRVMFGEYVPFSRIVPWLAQTPIGMGLTPGNGPTVFQVRGYRLAPSICFETTVPHMIRGHLRRLTRETGETSDILLSITDDGWFWGSSILDLHLACEVFRAVELRRPFIVAANTGISATIDGSGRILERLPHRREGFILAAVSRDGRYSLYERCGDVFAGACFVLSLWWTIRVYLTRRAAGRKPSDGLR